MKLAMIVFGWNRIATHFKLLLLHINTRIQLAIVNIITLNFQISCGHKHLYITV